MATPTKRKAKTVYTVQRLARPGRETCWYDVTEEFELLSTAKAALARWIEDKPGQDFRIEVYENA